MQRRHFLQLSAASAASFGSAALGLPLIGHAADAPKTIRLDYATYSPTSLVLKKFGWLEEDLKPSGGSVKWASQSMIFSRVAAVFSWSSIGRSMTSLMRSSILFGA